ncbi:MAG: hypothetical protein QOF62_2781 [Pyrinomonadaceae bacterium]|jgi:hypothetical protein|nr:hypothetical protein [Pyrinomonadaceae bacterium]
MTLTLRSDSLDWALDHALNFGDTTMFPLPFEYEAIKYDWLNVRAFLAGQDVLNWVVRPHRAMLSPKAKYGFRVMTQLDPLDFLIYASLVKEIGPDIELARIASDIAFSYRCLVGTGGQLFDPGIGYSSFKIKTEQVLDGDASISHVVAVTDISDFYPRIYSHRLENALHNSTHRNSHVKAIMHLLSGWNGSESFGIPVGNAPSRLLAEATISNVDDALLANGVRFVRYNDDYRIFATSYSQSYRHLAFLADVLYKTQGLTLQPQKTLTVPTSEFRRRFLPAPEERELDSLNDKFGVLLGELGLSDPYGEIEYTDLDPDQQKIIDSLNLVEIFREEIAKDDPDFGIIRFVLSRMGQLGDDSLVDDALDNLNSLHPIFPSVVGYLRNLRSITPTRSAEIGGKVLRLLEDSLISELDYHRMWALDLFTHSTEWDNETRFFALLGAARDQLSRRKLILAMGRAKQRHWFQSQWRSLFDEPHWPRRALLAAASCMPADARNHWCRSVEPRLDPLEKAVMRWAKNTPF